METYRIVRSDPAPGSIGPERLVALIETDDPMPYLDILLDEAYIANAEAAGRRRVPAEHSVHLLDKFRVPLTQFRALPYI